MAVFTHHLVDVERQSLAFSLDHGRTWEKFAGNPVLESTEKDFRDPKVFRHSVDGRYVWAMAVAVGPRVEFYRSPDLRAWERTGSYTADLVGQGAWECPDLVSLSSPDGPPTWLLIFGARVGPYGHTGTVGVPGDFDGHSFHASGPPALLDHGPDFYAAQGFSNR